jgi:hypothetical protein
MNQGVWVTLWFVAVALRLTSFTKDAQFAVLIPISLAPMIAALLWAQWKTRKAKRLRRTRPELKR